MPYWLHILIVVLVAYVLISIALYYLQDYMLFKPEKLPKDFEFYYENQDIEEHNLETRDGATINGILFKPKVNQKGLSYTLKAIRKVLKVGVNLQLILQDMVITF